MGPEIALALAAGGTAAQVIGAKQQQREQRSILNRAFDKTNASTQQGVVDTLGEAGKQTGTAQTADMAKSTDATTARTMADLKGAGADVINTAGDSGAQSQAFLTAKADRALTEGNRQTAIARELAKVRSAGEVQSNNAMSRGSLAERLASMGATSRADTQAATLDANDVQAPWYSDLGKIASMVGAVGGMMPAGGAPSAVTGIAGDVNGAEALAGAAAPSPLAAALGKIGPGAAMFGARRSAWAGR